MADILILGDVHAQIKDISRQLDLSKHVGYEPEAIIQVGDLGIWKDTINKFPDLDIPFYYVLGNHEDFHAELMIEGLPDCYIQLSPSKPIDICGLRSIGIGRSKYIDAYNTPPGSTIRYEDVKACLSENNEFDMIVTHDCPSGIGLKSNFFGPWEDVGSEFLEEILLEKPPNLWLFGHHHIDFTTVKYGCHLAGFKTANDGFGILNSDSKSIRFISSLTEK